MFTLVCSHFYSRLETLVRTDNKLVIEINLLSQWSKFIWMMEGRLSVRQSMKERVTYRDATHLINE